MHLLEPLNTKSLIYVLNRSFPAKLIEKRWLSSEHFLLKLMPEVESPEALPGQFYLLKASKTLDPLLRRPFSIFRSDKETLEFFIQKKGKGTTLLSEIPVGEVVQCIGPLGRGYPVKMPPENTVVVAGGMGIASLYPLLETLKGKTALTLIYGAKTKNQLFFLDELKSVDELILCTDDGSLGKRATTVDVLRKIIKTRPPQRVYACGPEIMNREVLRLLKESSIDGYISLEERMACGVGACLGCVKETSKGMKRVCTEGPVFSAVEL